MDGSTQVMPGVTPDGCVWLHVVNALSETDLCMTAFSKLLGEEQPQEELYAGVWGPRFQLWPVVAPEEGQAKGLRCE
jgi:hypothetical protein